MSFPTDQQTPAADMPSWRRLWRLRRLGLAPRRTREDHAIGIIDGLDGVRLKGWYIGGATGVEDNRFELLLDGISLGTLDASAPRPDVLAAEGRLDCGFAHDIRPLLQRLPDGADLLMDGRPHRFTMLSGAGKLVHEALVDGKPPVRGRLDRLAADGLSGWAVNELDPGRPVELEILLDGRHWFGLRTSQPRKDLTGKGIVGDVAGFQSAWPNGLLPTGTQVEVRSVASGETLANGVKLMADGHALPAESTYLDHYRGNRILPVTVIVPIHDAVEAVAECLASLDRHFARDADVLLLDDASTDPRIDALLRQYEGRAAFRVHRNACNLGYTRTVNLGISLCAGRDVVLLNSDTVATPHSAASPRSPRFRTMPGRSPCRRSDAPIPCRRTWMSMAGRGWRAMQAWGVCRKSRPEMVSACICAGMRSMRSACSTRTSSRGAMARRTISACAHCVPAGATW
jgi:hypothetical protein